MKKLFKILFCLTIIIIILIIVAYLFMKTSAFGALPSGKSLEKVKASKNYITGEFRNKESTELLTDSLWSFRLSYYQEIKGEGV